MASVTRFLEKKLKLRVNPKKSAVARTTERKFLGYRILSGGRLGIAPASLKRMKDRVRKITRRNRAARFECVIEELNRFLPGRSSTSDTPKRKPHSNGQMNGSDGNCGASA